MANRWDFYEMKQTAGSGWTSASLYTSLTGLPSYFKGDGNSHFQEAYDSNIAGLGQVFKKLRYNMTFLNNT
ncbi:MAG: hypothetical protein M3512_09290 [Bacteroidota bacterium]|nr:hypothetical protein [Bacteroidota bacterium]